MWALVLLFNTTLSIESGTTTRIAVALRALPIRLPAEGAR
jgi:hypothetical protein